MELRKFSNAFSNTTDVTSIAARRGGSNRLKEWEICCTRANEKAARQRDGLFLRENRSNGRHRQNSSGLKSYEPKRGGVKRFLRNNSIVFSSLQKCSEKCKKLGFWRKGLKKALNSSVWKDLRRLKGAGMGLFRGSCGCFFEVQGDDLVGLCISPHTPRKQAAEEDAAESKADA